MSYFKGLFDNFVNKSATKINEDNHDFEDSDFDKPQDTFFVVLHHQREGKTFIGRISKRSSRHWVETEVEGVAPIHWRGSTYMAYLDPAGVMEWIHKDYGRNYDVSGPFDDEHEAYNYAEDEYGEESLKESAELQDIGRKIEGSKAAADTTDDSEFAPMDDEKPEDVSAKPEDADPVDSKPADEEPPKFKIGDIVKPNKGQHANEPHSVIEIKDDGDLIIKPKDIDDAAIKYTSSKKMARIDPKNVELVKESKKFTGNILRDVNEVGATLRTQLKISDLIWAREKISEAKDEAGYLLMSKLIHEVKAGKSVELKRVVELLSKKPAKKTLLIAERADFSTSRQEVLSALRARCAA